MSGANLFRVMAGMSLCATAALATSPLVPPTIPPSPFKFEQVHCVAWKANKRLFLVRKLEPVGVSCAPVVKWTFDGEKAKSAELRVPIASFDSGEKDRDAQVNEILGAARQPEIIVRTAMISNPVWEHVWKGYVDRLPVTLVIDGREHSVELLMATEKRDGHEMVRGYVATKFSTLGLKVPQVAGGAVARVLDELELHFVLDRLKFKSQ